MTRKYLAIMLLLIFISFACVPDKVNEDTVSFHLAEEDIRILANQRILFAHKSVGRNIVQGLHRLIKSENHLSILNIKELSEGETVTKPGFYHLPNGQNGSPRSKCDSFFELLKEKNRGESFDIAFVKFCYVDFEQNSKVEEILDYYIVTISAIRNAFPGLKLIHSTTPLYTHAFSFTDKLKRMFYNDISNVKRNQYNVLLKNHFANTDPVFDLAQIESTYPDGDRATFRYNNKDYYTLADIYTNDGGHLNNLGQRISAMALIRLLIDVSKSQGTKNNA